MGDMGENGYLNMLCVESANAAADAVTIAPGDEHLYSNSGYLLLAYIVKRVTGRAGRPPTHRPSRIR